MYGITLYQAVFWFNSNQFEEPYLERNVKFVYNGNVKACELECINEKEKNKNKNRQLA